MGDYDKSLDDIIKQRNIGLKRNSQRINNKSNFKFGVKSQTRGGKQNLGRTKFGGVQNRKNLPVQQKSLAQDARLKLLIKQRLKVKDARETLLQKSRLTDARQKLNQKSKITDAREKLNKLATQQSKPAIKLTKQAVKPNALDLTRTVSNFSNVRANNARAISNNNNINKVMLTDDGLTIVTRPFHKQTIASPPTSLFVRTVDSLAKDVMLSSNLVKKLPNTLVKKRQYASDESDEEKYYSAQNKRVSKMIRHTPDEVTEVSRGISSNLQSRLGKQIKGQQGYRIIVSNLHTLVSERDLEDLFGDIGPIYGVQILQEGVAEVIYQRLADAEMSVEVYHKRELDGKPMGVKLVNLTAPKSSVSQTTLPSKYIGSVVSTGTLHSDNLHEVAAKSRITPDVGLFHKALFRSGTSSPAARTHAAFTVTM